MRASSLGESDGTRWSQGPHPSGGPNAAHSFRSSASDTRYPTPDQAVRSLWLSKADESPAKGSVQRSRTQERDVRQRRTRSRSRDGHQVLVFFQVCPGRRPSRPPPLHVLRRRYPDFYSHRNCLGTPPVQGRGGIPAGENFGGTFSFIRFLPKSLPPENCFAIQAISCSLGRQPTCLFCSTGARVLHARISLYAAAYPKKFFLWSLCIPKSDFVCRVCPPNGFLAYPLCISRAVVPATARKAPSFWSAKIAPTRTPPPPCYRITSGLHLSVVIVDIFEELVVVVLPGVVMLLVPHRAPEYRREQPVRHERQVVPRMGLHQKVRDAHVVQQARQAVLGPDDPPRRPAALKRVGQSHDGDLIWSHPPWYRWHSGRLFPADPPLRPPPSSPYERCHCTPGDA